MSFCIKKYLVFSLRKSNNTKYYRTFSITRVLLDYFLYSTNKKVNDHLLNKNVNEFVKITRLRWRKEDNGHYT